MNSSKQIKVGALISYITIAFNILAGLVYTPWMISQIGQDSYGLYTLATSLITVFVMDFGMGAAVSRFVTLYNAEGNQKNVNNFLGIVYKLYVFLDIIIFIVLVILYFFINNIYSNLTLEEINIFKKLYLIVGAFSILSFPFVNLNGILTAYEKFTQLKLCDLFNKVFIVVAMVIALLLGNDVYALVMVNAISGILTILIKLIIIHMQTPVRINLKFFDRNLLKRIFEFSAWTTVGSIAQRMIFNITPSIIAAVSKTGSVGVAFFGLASTIEGYVYMIATAINGMFMPRISNIVVNGKKDEQLLPLAVKIGRIQLMIIGIVTVGFVVFGKSFIVDIWNKPDFVLSYYCAVFLIIPSVFYLPMQIANTTLIVENKVKLQAYVFIIMGVINLVCSLILSRFYGALGATISIFIAYMIRNVLMIVIYHRILKINMCTFFKEVFLKISPHFFISFIVGVLVEIFNPLPHGYIRFFVNGIILISVFFVLLAMNGFNEYEKNLLTNFIKKKKRSE